MVKIKLLLATLFFSTVMVAQEKTNSKFGKGILNVVAADTSWSMKFSARFQTLYEGQWNLNDTAGITEGTSKFLTRRARLKFEGFVYSPKLEYKIELGLSNKDISGASSHTGNSPNYILDAVLKWNFYKNFTLWAGQTKLPGNRERVISSANLQLVDRSLLNNQFNIDRDMGVQLHHEFKLGDKFEVREAVAVSQGEGRNVTDDNLGGYQWTGRVEFLPLGAFAKEGDYLGGDLAREEKPKLSIAATYDKNNHAVKTASNLGKYMVNDNGFFETDIYTYFVDMMFKYKGFSLMSEYANREAEQAIAKNSDGTETGAVVNVGTGINAQMGYLFKNNWEVATRFTYIELDKKITGKDIERQYTLGLSKYIVGHKLKIQSDVSYLDIQNNKDHELMYRLQIDVHF